MSQEDPPITVAEGNRSDSYYVYENSLSIIQFQVCWIWKGWTVHTTGIVRFKNDQNPHVCCYNCYTFVYNRVKLKCKMWRKIMEESLLAPGQRTITGQSIRDNVARISGHRDNYVQKLRSDYLHRTRIMNVPENRIYNGECVSPFDVNCVGSASLRLNR